MIRTFFATLLAASSAAAQTLPTWEFTREVVLDGTAKELTAFQRLVVTPSGTIYLAQHRGIQVYGPDRIRRGTFGQDGAGPGDFRGISALGMVGDSIWALDPNNRRVTIISPELRLVRTWKMEDARFPRGFPIKLPRMSGAFPLAVFGDGSYLASGSIWSWYVEPRTPERPGLPILSMSAKGEVNRIVGWTPLSQDVRGPADNPSDWATSPYNNAPVDAISIDGSRVVTVVANLPDSAPPTVLVTVFRSTGDTVYSKQFPAAALRIPEKSVDSAFSRYESGWKSRPRVVEALRSMTRPTYYPILENVLVATNGMVLVGFKTDGDRRDHLIIAPNGDAVGMVALPKSARPMQLDDTVIWANQSDADHVQSLVRFTIRPKRR